MDQKSKKSDALETCNLNMVRFLIKQGVTFDKDELGTVLTKMCEKNNLQIKKWIEEFKISPTQEELDTALVKSIEEENFNKIKRWITLGSNVNSELIEKKASEKEAEGKEKLASMWRSYKT